MAQEITNYDEVSEIDKSTMLMLTKDGALGKKSIEEVGKVINGETDISGIGDGTVTGAIGRLNDDLNIAIKGTYEFIGTVSGTNFHNQNFNSKKYSKIAFFGRKEEQSAINNVMEVPISLFKNTTYEKGYIDYYVGTERVVSAYYGSDSFICVAQRSTTIVCDIYGVI